MTCWLFHKWGKWVFYGSAPSAIYLPETDKTIETGIKNIYKRNCSRCGLEKFKRVKV